MFFHLRAANLTTADGTGGVLDVDAPDALAKLVKLASSKRMMIQ